MRLARRGAKLPQPAAIFFALGLAIHFAAPTPATAQGCALCRDATAGSAPQTRKALRLAIPLLAIPAIGIFAGGLVAALGTRRGDEAPKEAGLGAKVAALREDRKGDPDFSE
jgi:hypothetical protein